jgi:hypothetical protein
MSARPVYRWPVIPAPLGVAASPCIESERVKVCYCDESGTGEEPYATMAGIVLDASRMHRTKRDWAELLKKLSALADRTIPEFKTNDFYYGNGLWRNVTGHVRAGVITSILNWLHERKHHIVYSAVDKWDYQNLFDDLPSELRTPWRFMGFHLILAMQKAFRNHEGIRGHTFYVFDNQERERMRFSDLVIRPPDWSGAYYGRRASRLPLDLVIDVPYFADSRDVGLLQLADFVAFFLRRYAEVKEGGRLRYPDERERLDGWIGSLMKRSIGKRFMYPAFRRQDEATRMFWTYAPIAIRELG